ncbi:MAG: SPOR domain-containing protein [Candidatus Andeanibacterium colombiense]|uniref:SPOR domain-containing protein n=1 Tax=Candidatus Andeanibacterium colombiense TaxID=3121345 RepID=A0AAJ5X906_9SPHN|nr:MAG: SPOR domain-containing protein [Sphingomonadaceae bacterium]
MAINPYGDEEEAAEAAAATQTEQLDLDDREEQLPWLEGDDEYEETGVDTARIAAFAIIGLLVVGLIVGGIWLATRPKADAGLVADGSTIPAPPGPYKEKPANPGGKQFAGTGDTSFAVGEGKSREGQIAEDAEPVPSIDTQAASPVAKGVGVQVGAYQSKDTAEAGWTKLVSQYPLLSGSSHRVVEGQADIGKVFRLQAIAGDRATANSLCSRLKAAGGSCQVK